MKSIRNRTIAVFTLALLTSAGLAFADGEKDAPAPKQEVQQGNDGESKERPILAGPKVEEEAKTGAAVSRMGEQQRPPRAPIMQHVMWMRMVRSLDLNEEQTKKIDAVVEAQRKAMQKFQEEHGEALRALQGRMREAREAQDREKMQELMGQARELRGKAPQPERVQNAIWGFLTDQQQETLKERIAQWQKEREERMRERAQRLQRGQGAAEAMDGDDDEAMNERPQRRRPAASERPARQRGEGVRGRPAPRGEGQPRPQRGARPDAPQPERERPD